MVPSHIRRLALLSMSMQVLWTRFVSSFSQSSMSKIIPSPPLTCNSIYMQRHPKTFASSTRRALSTTSVSPAIQSTLYSHEDVVQLSYSEFQPSSSKGTSSQHPPVILLHGLLGNKRNFASLASSLSTQLQNPRSIYTVDLRNHGENTHDWKNTMSYSEMARDVLAFIDKISSEKAVIVGHSMGGKVAQSLALMAPERVAGLVVLDISPVRYYSDNNKAGGDDSGWKVVEQIVRSVAQIDLEEGGYKTKREVDAVLRDGILEDPALRAFVLTNLEQLRAKDISDEDKSQSLLKWKIHWDGIVNELDRIAGFDVHDQSMDPDLEALDEQQQSSSAPSQYTYDGDVFFIHGGASRFVRSSHLSTITSYFPNHMLTTIRGVGHWVHAEAPDDTIALLKRYLDR